MEKKKAKLKKKRPKKIRGKVGKKLKNIIIKTPWITKISPPPSPPPPTF